MKYSINSWCSGLTPVVLAQILAEVKLEDRLSPLAPEFSSLEPAEPKELPWCVICNALGVTGTCTAQSASERGTGERT